MNTKLRLLLALLLVSPIIWADTLIIKTSFSGEIQNDTATRFVRDLLGSTQKGTEVYLYLTSQGGDTDIGYQIADNMERNGSVDTVVVTKYAYSMGAMLVCAADRYQVANNAELMYHMAYYLDISGKKVLITQQNDHQLWAKVNKLLHRCGFLTKSEIARINAGEDIYLTGKEIKQRLRGK